MPAKRTRIKPKGDARYVRRGTKGRIKESDDVGRSTRQDRAKRAKRTTTSGQGDRGDRAASARPKRAAQKRVPARRR